MTNTAYLLLHQICQPFQILELKIVFTLKQACQTRGPGAKCGPPYFNATKKNF